MFPKNDSVQYLSPAEIKAYQEMRLQEELIYLQAHSPFYRELFAKNGIDITSIRTLEDLTTIPPVTKDDLQKRNADFICVSASEIIDYVTTSGTLGEPVLFALTSGDLDRLAYNEYLSFSTAGCTKNDILQLMTTIDRRFMAGLAYFMGARELGCGSVRVGNGIPELQWDTIRRIQSTACVAVPSFLLKLIEYAEQNGIDHTQCSLKRAICIGESLRNQDMTLNTLGQKIQEKWGSLQLHSTYASTEMQSSFTECGQFAGGHLPPDLIIVEFLGLDDKPVAPGEYGEVTITTLGVRGMPLLRFKTGDVCKYDAMPCACGRNTIRLSPLLGRKGQMIKYKGTTLYPPALYDILDTMHEVHNYIIEVYTNQIGTDEIVIKIGSHNKTEEFEKRIKDVFRSKVRVAPSILFEPIDLIDKLQKPPMSRKVLKFKDLREQKW
ncbi:MAG: phenylacetate--CoA ligase family protein [Bacteroidales bacterium]